MEVSRFTEKLNKVDGNIYVTEEEVCLTDGVYEGELQHDNINLATLAVWTGSKLTGERIQSYVISTPSMTPWKRIIRVYAEVQVLYVSYETDGDTVEADDMNRVQAAVVVTQEALNAETVRAAGEEKRLRDDLEGETERAEKAENSERIRAEGAEKILTDDLESEADRAVAAEKKITDGLAAEAGRAKAAEKSNADSLAAETARAKAKETELQGNINAHTTTVNGEIQALKAADTALEGKKADTAYVNTELGKRYTKEQVYTKEEVLKKIEDLIGSAPETLDTLKEVADALGNDPNFAGTIISALAGKVDRVSGKQLSANDYSDAEKAMVADVNAKKHIHSNQTVLDKVTQAMLDNLSAAFTHISDLVKHVTAAERTNWTDAYNRRHEHGNKTLLDGITQALVDKWNSALTAIPSHTHTKSQITDMPAKLSQFTNDPGFITQSDVDTSQNHSHSNKTVLDRVTQALLDNWSAAYTHIGNKSNPHAVTKSHVGLGSAENKSGATIRSEMTKAEVVVALGYTPPETSVSYTHPTTSGNRHIPAGGAAGQFLKWSADGTAVWAADNNTTYAAFKAAAASAAGGTGLVPAPAAGAQAKYLRADGTWQAPPNTTYGAATTSAAGLMSAADKAKLDALKKGPLTWGDLKGV